ncbi:MAG: poly(3-hydroxybutyrate) depolymerase [Bacteroidetes bacterium]|nr:poly(3-hydroxybutyrate) depolymerase [Bacteroidota bacterium]
MDQFFRTFKHISRRQTVFTVFVALTVCIGAQAQTVHDSIFIGTDYRTFHYMQPARTAAPKHLIFILHGSGGHGTAMMREASSLLSISRQEHLLLVFPDGYKRFWNECRKASGAEANLLDVDEQSFFLSLIRRFAAQYGTDTTTAFAVGFSGGGHMAYKLALTLPERFKGITAVVANLPDSVNMDCTASGKPVSVMIANGTADEINPYNGGEVVIPNVKLGTVRSTVQTMRYWAALVGYSGAPQKESLNDTIPSDGISINRYTFASNGKKEVVLLEVVNGTHKAPPGMDIFIESWEFFRRQIPYE